MRATAKDRPPTPTTSLAGKSNFLEAFRGRAPQLVASSSSAWLLAAFVCVLLLQIELLWNRPINWDEFYHLSETHAFSQGRLTEALQVFYARAFFWLPASGLEVVDQIRLARFFMLLCELCTTWFIFSISRQFVERTPAALAALAYLTAGYVLQHGISFRADPMAAAFLMGALWIVATRRLNSKAIVGAALLIALGALTTIKIVLYLPAFAGIAWLRWQTAEDRQSVVKSMVAILISSVLMSALFIVATVATLPVAGTGSAEKVVVTSGTMMFAEGLFPRWPYILEAIKAAPLSAVFILLVPGEIWRSNLDRASKIGLIGLLLPLASIAFYRNSFPYFYAFILPPVLVAASLSARSLSQRISPYLLAIVLLASALASSIGTPREVLPRQEQVLAAADEIFPDPVSYIDYSGMLPEFRKANFFITTWGLLKYRGGLETSLVETMSSDVVPLLLVNMELLERNQTGPETAWELLPDDARALRESFVQHWGPIWVAGRRFGEGETSVTFSVYAPGRYTLEGGAATLDGRPYQQGETLVLSRGEHRFERISPGEITLRWGNHLARPAEPFVGGEIFRDF